MSWTPWLEPDESLRWEARPAPRCWTFRNWRHSLFGAVLLLIALWWQQLGLGLQRETGQLWWALLPLPLVLAGAWLAVGHLVVARCEWSRVAYAVTERRILLRRGLLRSRLRQLPLARLRYCTLTPLGAELAHLRLADVDGVWLTLCCVEHPGRVLPLLEAAIIANGAAPGAGPAGESV